MFESYGYINILPRLEVHHMLREYNGLVGTIFSPDATLNNLRMAINPGKPFSR